MSAPESSCMSITEIRALKIAADRVRRISGVVIGSLRDEMYRMCPELGIARIDAILEDVVRSL